jgi:hypothetical protein
MEMKIIPINPAYKISPDGTMIINMRNGNQIKSSVQLVKGKPSGYIYTTLCSSIDEDGLFISRLPKRIAVHRLVAFTYLPDPPTGKHVWVNHKDGNKSNNHHSNLEWTTISQNIQHSYDVLGRTTPKGPEHWMYGKKVSNDTKRKMSEAKRGIKHPKFTGYYYANFKRFESAHEAAKYLKMNVKTLYNRCHNPKFRLKGFYFVPC